MMQTDKATSINEFKKIIQKIIDEREWNQFHSPKSLSMAISIEANELMEKFLWITTQDSFKEYEKNPVEIEDEIGDVLVAVIAFCNINNIDLTKAFLNKIEKIQQKYPIEKCKGIYTKHDKL